MCTIQIKGNALTALRIKRGFSMNEFARRINLNVGVISRIENCTTNPRPKTAQKICDALGVQFDELFELVSNTSK